MSEQKQNVPRYIEIKNYIKDMASKLNAHDKILSEPELSKLFNVSRGTAKQAVVDLVYEEVLYRKQGKGTFVSPAKMTRTFNELPSFTNDIRRMGINPKTNIISIKKITPTHKIAKLFNLALTDYLIRVKRLVCIDHEPVVVVYSYLNPHIYPNLSKDEIDQSLYASLQKKYNLVPTKAEDTYSIISMPSKIAEYLLSSKSDSVCYSQRIAYLEDNTSAEYVESYIKSDRFKISVNVGMGLSANSNNDKQVIEPNNCSVFDLNFIAITNN